MKKLLSALFALVIFGATAPQAMAQAPQGDQQRLTPQVMARLFPAGVKSPEYNQDGTVTFRFEAPNAKVVELDCQMLSKRMAMTKNENGIWTATVTPPAADIYPYCFIMDGVQVTDPNNVYIFPNEGFKNSLVNVKAESPSMQDLQRVPHGKVSYCYYHSDNVGFDRPMCVYTPAGYDPSNGKTYPVLYLIHGMTDTYETWTQVGNANIILDNLIAQGKAEEMIIVMPYANPYPEMIRRGLAERYDAMGTDIVTKELLNEVIPYIESNFKVKKNAKSRAIAGFSLGGRQALAAGFGNPNTFNYVCAFAPAIFGNEAETNFENGVYASAGSIKKNMKFMWVSCGTEDGLLSAAKSIDKALTDRGLEHTAQYNGGGHTWMNCRDWLEIIATKLFK